MRPVSYLSTVLFALTLLTIPIAAVTADIADGEREFVQQLLDRRMFDLAEQFCHRRITGYANIDDRADWELILSECQLQHAWDMNEDSRNGTISQSAQRITEFLRTNTPAAEKDILLRVRQIELLAAASVMEEIVQAPLSSSSRDGSLASAASPRSDSAPNLTERTGLPIKKPSPGTAFALEATNQAQLLAEGLLKQIDQIRRDVDSDVVRTARERIRMAQAQMLFARVRLAPSQENGQLFSQADALVEPLAKSAGDDRLRFQARLMQAEIPLEKNDFQTFKLRFGNVTSSAASAEQKASALAMKIRSQLKQGQPSDALLEYHQAISDGQFITPELQTLRLQSLLQRLELLFQLDESKQQAELLSKTAAEFLPLKQQTLATTLGVWRQRGLRIATQFERVYQVGPETAAEFDKVAELVDAGETKAARQRLSLLVQRSGTGRPKIRAALLLQAGQLAIQLKDWEAASVDLRQARDLWLDAKDVAGAAAADLLRVYVIGQQWNFKSSAGITEDTYLQGLEEHLTTFAGQPTVRQAQEWRARLLRTSAPLKSAEELLTLAAEERSSDERAGSSEDTTETATTRHLYLLCLAGDHLLEAIATAASANGQLNVSRENAESETAMSALSARFLSELQQQPESSDPAPLAFRAILEAQQLGLNLQEKLGTDADWKTMMATSRRLRTLLTDHYSQVTERATQKSTAASSETEIGQLMRRAISLCEAMTVLSGIRQLADASEYESARTSLLAMPIAERFRVVRQLRTQLTTSPKPTPGDSQLAHVLISFIDSPSEEKSAWTTELRIQQVRLLQTLTAVAGTSQAFERSLNELVTLPLTDSEISAVADVVSQSAAGSVSGPASAQARAGSRRFWQSVLKKTQPGQDAWLEASLQMAHLAQSSGDKKEALKILGVVSVLHPEWGTPTRKARAAELRMRLEKSQ